MTFKLLTHLGGAAGLSLLIGVLPAAAAEGTGTHREEYLGTSSTPSANAKAGSTESIGTQPEEYGNPPAPKAAPKGSQKTEPKVKIVGTPGSPESVKAKQKVPPNQPPKAAPIDKPGTLPGEYQPGIPRTTKTYDTVHNVRIDKSTPHPESATSEKKKR